MSSMRRPEPLLPSFTLVLNQAPYPPPLIYGSSPSERVGYVSYASSQQIPLQDPSLPTINFHDENMPFFPTLAWTEPPELEKETMNLQAALQQDGGIEEASHLKRLRFSALVVDLALRVRRRCMSVFSSKSKARAC
ncbi:hypothetical protein GLOTRDRAFT_126828 [Gloeophyllum trabeum ATCC 11539]|uniref:Uncharacterized protein n=1 Tax=Gloeophyllum trabeum (strain ATCC 11539 / FP-39264 / Madison 617) TaxID=670483 RepID=S7RUC8_GLOTA|nr:uncharacterized protein GLOTRDRAFT_126828 [Gloeophyllum trabeum ATCC 11539]EPQ58335.1 hypothetical protein GLOTRDRAFT_126828 [Gloeophyllum trabeum ATCC 11539]